MLLLVLTILVTASSVYHLQSKRGLPLVNQILGWVILGEISPHFYFALQTNLLSVHCSLCFIVPIRLPDHAPKLALENPLVLPRFLGLLRDTLYQR